LGRLIATSAAALVLGPAISAASQHATAASHSRTVVAYIEEQGGIIFRYKSLAVSTTRQATVRAERRMVRFRVDGALWRKLIVALKQTNVHAVAGNYVPAARRADESTWVITVGRDRVRIGDFGTIRPELRAKLEPLLKVLVEVLAVGERRIKAGNGSA
jgi:hypothetical protein